MKVSLVITCLNEESTIDWLLKGIANQVILPNEIIIVDGGSSDRTKKIITHCPHCFNTFKNEFGINVIMTLHTKKDEESGKIGIGLARDLKKIVNKKILKGKKIQLNLSDGKNFLSISQMSKLGLF